VSGRVEQERGETFDLGEHSDIVQEIIGVTMIPHVATFTEGTGQFTYLGAPLIENYLYVQNLPILLQRNVREGN